LELAEKAAGRFTVACEKFDVVRLKSSGPSGPNMTVLDVSESGVQCCWFDRSGKLREKIFPDEVLVEARSSNLTINFNLRDDNEAAKAQPTQRRQVFT
jgi:uncharacterized protein YodC (DUF2158 family)